MKLINLSNGGTKLVFEPGDFAHFRNPFGLAYGVELEKFNVKKREWEGKNIIFSDLVADKKLLKIEDVLPPNPHVQHDIYRYVVKHEGKDGKIHNYLLAEVYFGT